MTKAEFKKQLDALCKQMMVENTGYESVEKWEVNTPDFANCQTEEEENEWQTVADKVAETNDWIVETLQNQALR